MSSLLRPLSISVVSKMDRYGGGASRAAETLVRELRKRGQAATLLTVLPTAAKPHHEATFPAGLGGIFGLHQRLSQSVLGAVAAPLELPFLARRLLKADVVHFQDTFSAISPATVWWTAQRRPTLYTFHDCSPFTGFCLYPEDCDRYKTGCGSCPQRQRSRTKVDVTRACQAWKRHLFQSVPVTGIAPSAWMARMAEDSRVFRDVRVVPNSIDLETFTYGRREAARKQLSIALDARVIVLAASSLKDSRKGTTYAVEALRAAAGRLPADTLVLLVGADSEGLAPQFSQPTRALGFVSSDSLMAAALAAADVCLFPTLADNLPYTVMESMASGTPVIAFDNGGVPEMIAHGETGWLVRSGDTAGLAECLTTVLANETLLRATGKNAAEFVRGHYGPDALVGRHLALYEEAIREHSQLRHPGT
jgi:glycosyltransferase involved in cell wall biosynthesis